MRHSTVLPSRLLLSLAATLFAVGCTLAENPPVDAGVQADAGTDAGTDAGVDAGTDAGPDPIAVTGTWDDNYGSTTVISDSVWGGTTVISYDNTTRTAITQNPASDQYNPSKFNKFVWTAPAGGEFWFCWLTYGKDTAEAAQNDTAQADATDPASSGCGGFAWTHLVTPLTVKGTWDDSYGGTTLITSFEWGSAAIVKKDNETRVAITQNPASDQYNPSKFNKFVWTPVVDGSFWFCWLTYGKDTAAAAESATDVADATNPAEGGCGGFAWTQMRLPIDVKGTFDDDWGSSNVIDSFKWGGTTIVKLNNTAREAITQNPASDQYNPSKFNKFVWTAAVAGEFWFCWVTYGKDTAAAAEAATDVADATNPAESGCGEFAWTHMRVPLSIKGAWDDNLGGSSTITTFKWDTKAIVKTDETARFIIARNSSQDVNPGKYSKIVWTTPSETRDFWYCPVATNEDTAAAAENTTEVADSTSPATGGCGGFSWTHLVTPLALKGEWLEGSTPLSVTTFFWGTESVELVNNAAAVLVTRNPSDTAVDPGKFSKIVWTALTSDSVWYCRVVSGQDSISGALALGAYDSTDVEHDGCNGGPWTQLTRVVE